MRSPSSIYKKDFYSFTVSSFAVNSEQPYLPTVILSVGQFVQRDRAIAGLSLEADRRGAIAAVDFGAAIAILRSGQFWSWGEVGKGGGAIATISVQAGRGGIDDPIQCRTFL